jgi:type VI secretion system secreted protein Hcp
MKINKKIAAASFVLALVPTTGALAQRSSDPAPVGPNDITLQLPTGKPTGVLAWSWGASNSGTLALGGGGGAGKANFQDLSLTRFTDLLSPSLLSAVAKGTHLSKVILKKGTMTITMEPAMVSSYSTGGSAGDPSGTTENVTFNFSKVTYEIANPADPGSNPAKFCWDIAENAAC